MPAGKPGTQSIKHYGAVSTANADVAKGSVRVAPASADRTFFTIQNTGANPGLLRFGEPCKGDGSDIVFAINSPPMVWDQADTCPVEAINLASVLGTTWAIAEGTMS